MGANQDFDAAHEQSFVPWYRVCQQSNIPAYRQCTFQWLFILDGWRFGVRLATSAVLTLQLCTFLLDLLQWFSLTLNQIFIAPGVFAQLQPLFLERRDIYLVREKKSKTYSWVSFCTSQIVSEFPYLVIAAVLYFCCFYFTVGFPLGGKAASSFFVMLMYQFLYTVSS